MAVHYPAGDLGREVYFENLERGLKQLKVVQLGLAHLLVDEFSEVELLVVLRQQLPQQVPVREVRLEVVDLVRQLHLVVQPRKDQITHTFY